MTVVALATVEQVKGYLGMNCSQDDALLERLVVSASGYIQTWLNRELGLGQYTETLSGTDGATMMLKNTPVTDVSEVLINGLSIPLSTSAYMAGYVFDDAHVALRGYRFSAGMLNVSITYSAGYAQVPEEVTQACIEMVSMRYREKDRIGLTSKGLAGETIGFSQKDMADSTRHILQQFRRVWPR